MPEDDCFLRFSFRKILWFRHNTFSVDGLIFSAKRFSEKAPMLLLRISGSLMLSAYAISFFLRLLISSDFRGHAGQFFFSLVLGKFWISHHIIFVPKMGLNKKGGFLWRFYSTSNSNTNYQILILKKKSVSITFNEIFLHIEKFITGLNSMKNPGIHLDQFKP